MLKISRIFLCAVVALSFIACNTNSEQKSEPFKYIQAPQFLKGAEATNYMARNFWKNYTSNTDSISLEDASLVFVRLLLSAEEKYLNKALENAFTVADSVAVRGDKRLVLKLISDAEKFFYHPNSPYLNEEVYLEYLKNYLNAKGVSDLDKMAYHYQYNLCSLNRVGTVASDFEYKALEKSGEYTIARMHSIKGDYTLLFFNNPDCPACEEIKNKLKESVIMPLVKKGKVKVLAMYIDQELDVWQNRRDTYPKEWIYAHDPHQILNENELYGLRAIPSLYLLDKEKRVILKDAPVEIVIEYLNTI